MSAISYEELGALSGELLPERTVLSLATPMDGGSGGAVVTGVCSLNQGAGSGSLLGILAVSAGTQQSTCVPVAAAG